MSKSVLTAEEQRAQLRLLKRKKKQDKIHEEGLVGASAALEQALQDGDAASIRNELERISPADLLAALFVENQLGVAMVSLAIASSSRVFFSGLIQKMEQSSREATQRLIAKDKKYFSRLYGKIARQLANLKGDDGVKFCLELLAQYMLQPLNPLRQIFRCFMDFQSIKDTFFEHERRQEIFSAFQTLARKLELPELAATLQEYIKYCKCQRLWTKDIVVDPKEDISSYQLPELGINVLHYFAEQLQVDKFLQQANNEHPGSLYLFNSFNCSGETPVDVALRKFEPADVAKVVEMVELNRLIRLSVSTLNKLLDNRHLNEDQLLKFIVLASSPKFAVKGYVKKSQIKFGQYDYVEVSEDQCLLKAVDALQEFPLLKYIRKSSSPRLDILGHLTFKELRYKNSVTQYCNFIKINEVIKKITFHPHNRLLYRKIRDVKGLLMPAEIEHFEQFIRPILEAALKKNHEPSLLYLIDNIACNIFLVHLTDGANLFPHLLREALTRKLQQPVDQLLKELSLLAAYKPTLTDADFKCIFEGTEFSHRGVVGGYSTNLLNELLCGFSSISQDLPALSRIKGFLKEEYLKNPSELNSVCLEGTKIRFVINKLWFLMSPVEAAPFYQSFCEHILAKINEDNADDAPGKEEPGIKKVFVKHETALAEDLFVDCSENKLLFCPESLKPRDIRHAAPQHNELLEYIVGTRNATTTSLLTVLLKADILRVSMPNNLTVALSARIRELPDSIVLMILEQKKIQPIVERLMGLGRFEDVLPVVDVCVQEADKNRNFNSNIASDPANEDPAEENPVTEEPNKEAAEKKPTKIVPEAALLITLLNSINTVMAEHLTEKNFPQLKKVIDAMNHKITFPSASMGEVAGLPSFTKTLHGIDQNTANTVRMLALLGIDTKFCLSSNHFKVPNDDASFKTAIELMLKYAKTFIEVACLFGTVQLSLLREILQNKFVLTKAGQLIQIKVCTQGYTLKTSSLDARLLVLQMESVVWSSEKMEFEKARQKLISTEPQRILHNADTNDYCGLMSDFLSKTSFVENLVKSHPKEAIHRYWKELKSFNAERARDANYDYGASQPNSPFRSEDQDSQIELENKCLLKIVEGLVQVSKRRNPPNDAIKALFKQHFPPEVFFVRNAIGGFPKELMKLASRHLDEDPFFAVATCVFDPDYPREESWDQQVIELLCEVVTSKPNLYFKLLHLIAGPDTAYTNNKLQYIFCRCLKKIITAKPEVALRQVEIAFDQGILTKKQWHQMFQCSRMKGNAELVLSLLFITGGNKSFRIAEQKKIYNIFDNPISTMEDAHFKLYLKLALDKVKKNNQKSQCFQRQDPYERKKEEEARQIKEAEEEDNAENNPSQKQVAKPPEREFLQSRLEKDYFSCVRAGKWRRALQIVEGLLSIEAKLDKITDDLKGVTRFHDRKEVIEDADRTQLCQKLYEVIKRTTKEEVTHTRLIDIFRLNPKALKDIPLKAISFSDYIWMVTQTYKFEDSILLQNRVTESGEEYPDCHSLLKIAVAECESSRIALKSLPYYLTIISHVQFMRKYCGQENIQNQRLFPSLLSRLMLRLETDQKVACVFSEVEPKAMKSYCFTHKASSNFDSLLAVIPNLLVDSTKEHRFKSILLRFGSPLVLRSLVSKKVFTLEDGRFIVVCGDLQTAQTYFKQIGDEATKELFNNESTLTDLMTMCNQEYSISIIRQLGLEEAVSSFERKRNIFDVLCMYNRTKLFNYIIGDMAQKGKLQTLPLDHPNLQRALTDCCEMGRYECRFISELGCEPSKFSVLTHLLSPVVLDNQIQVYSAIPSYQERLKKFSLIRKLMEDDLDEPTKKRYGLPDQKKTPSKFSVTIYECLLRLVLEIGELPDYQMLKGLHLETLSKELLFCLKALTSGIPDKTAHSPIIRATPTNTLLFVMLFYTTAEPGLARLMEAEFPRQIAVARLLQDLYPEGLRILDSGSGLDKFALVLSSHHSKTIEKILYRYYPREVLQLQDVVESGSMNLENSFWLLPEIVKQQKEDLLQSIISALQKSLDMRFCLVLLLASNFPQAVPLCLKALASDSTDANAMLLELAQEQNPGFFQFTIKHIRLLEEVPNYHAAYENSDHARSDIVSMISTMQRQFQGSAQQLSNEFPSIDITEFLKELESAALAAPKKVVTTKLGLIKTYAHLLNNLRHLQNLKLGVKLNVKVSCKSFDDFDKGWIALQTGGNSSGLFQCLVEIVPGDILCSHINIEQHSRNIARQVNLRQFFVMNNAVIKQKLNEKATSWHASHSNHITDIETIELDSHSFSKVVDTEALDKLFGAGSISESKLLFLDNFFDEVEGRIIDVDVGVAGALYEIDDVTAPHNSQPGQDAVIEYFPELYKLSPVASRQLELVYVGCDELAELKRGSKDKIARDILAYVEAFVQRRTHPDAPAVSDFTNRLYYSSENGAVRLLPSYYSAWNLLELYSIVSAVYNELVYCTKKIAFGFDFKSLTELVLRILKATNQDGFFEATSRLLKAQNLVVLLHKLLLVLTESGTNIDSVVKGVRVEFAESKKEPGRVAVLAGPPLSISSIRYEIKCSVMKVVLHYQLDASVNKFVEEAAPNEQAEGLVNQQDIFNCIFSTPEQLTNYFLDRRNLDVEMHRIANNLSQANAKMVHVSIDYASIYKIVRELEKTRSISEIGGMLSGVINYVRGSLQEKLQNDYTSSKMKMLYQLNLSWLAQAISEGNTASIHDIAAMQRMSYAIDYSQPSLKIVQNFSGQVALQHKQYLVNTFMVQIYRRYFMSSFLVGNVYALGFENRVSVFIAKDRNSINSIDVQNLKWVLWLTRKLPDEVFLDPNMVIGLYVCDLAGNFFKLNEKIKTYLLDPEKEDQRQLDINELIPVLPTNVLFTFVDSEKASGMPEMDLKRSESSVRNPQQNQTIQLALNTGSGAIKQSEFRYPNFSLVHNFRLSTSIQSRVQNFRRFLKDYHQEAEGQSLEFSFDSSLSQLPDMQLFENTLNVVLYELEKAFEQFAKLEQRDKTVEENIATLQPTTLLNRNYLSMQRLRNLRKMFQRLQIVYCEGRNADEKMQFRANRISIAVDLKSSQHSITFMEVLEALANAMIERVQSAPPKDLAFQLKKDVKVAAFELHEKLKLLDILLLVEQQMANCQVVNAYNKAVGGGELQYVCEIVHMGTTGIRTSGSTVFLTLAVKENVRLHTFTDVLCAMHKLNKDPLVNDSRYQFTEYAPAAKAILLYNYTEPVTNVVTLPLSNISKAQLLTKVECIDREGKKQLPLVLPNQQSRIYIVRTQSTLSYNIADPKLITGAGNFKVKIGDSVSMCFNILSAEYLVLPLDKVALSYKQDKLIYQLLSPKEHCKVELRQPTRNIISLVYTNNIVSKAVIKNPTLEFPHELLNKNEQLEYVIETESFNRICVENTKTVGIFKAGKMVNAPEKERSAAVDSDRFFEPPEKAQMFRLSRQAEGKVDIAEILSGQRPMTVAEKQYPFVTKAGHQRVEVVVLRDSYHNEIKPDLNDISFVFEYADNPALKMVPTKHYSEEGVRLVWQPFVRGRYNLFINDTIVDTGYEIVVSAEDIDLAKTSVELPHVRTLSYCEQSSFSVRYRDRFGNIFSDLEHKINKDGVLLELVALSSSDTVPSKYLQYSVKDVDQFGVQTCQFHLNLPDSNESSEVEFHLTILFMREDLQKFDVKVRGLSIEKRRVLFNQELNQVNRQPRNIQRYLELEIQVNRGAILDKMISLVDQNLMRGISIRFDGEPGVDAGGLKREFYDLVGALMKNEKFPFFKPIMVRNRTCYALNPELMKNKKRDVYMKTFGKFLANSILNNYLIGIDFADSLVKALYGDSIEFNDLKDLMSAEEFSRYEHLLKASEREIEDSDLDFSLFENGKQVQLVDGGASIQVTRSNVEKYLNCVADFKIRRLFEEPIQMFLEGFNSVFSFDLIKKWFQPREFSIFTCGIKQLQSQSIVDLLVFDNSKPMIEEWFKRYIRECSSAMLGNFLKFTTGASTVPFDTSSYKIEIVFVNTSPKKLPISHTCWKSLEVPLYKSYEALEKKLNTAFTFGAEGFGFA